VWLLTFDNLLADISFTGLMRKMLKTLEEAYQYPVDVEFTINFTAEGTAKIDVVQCRPLQTKGLEGQEAQVDIPESVPEAATVFRSEGNFMGGNISQAIKWIIWIEPAEYLRLPLAQKYEVARLVGRLNKRIADRTENHTMLLGPGRWGTSTPMLGVPTTFAEINNFTAIAEVAFTSGDLMPELSFGSHFFQDLVETDIFYVALFPENRNCFFNEAWMHSQRNALEGLLPASSRYKNVVKVYRAPDSGMRLTADVVRQKVICFMEEG
jgi:hypothetical protein